MTNLRVIYKLNKLIKEFLKEFHFIFLYLFSVMKNFGKRKILQTIAIIINLIRISFEFCPDRCKCQHQIYDCSLRSLENAPNVDNAREINLSSNKIKTIPSNWLENSTNIEKLYLDNNILKTIDQQSFNGTNRLKLLNLSYNAIEELIIINYSYPLPSLISLDLSNNQLIKIPKNLVNFAPNLELLYLSMNQIKTLYFDISYLNMKSLTYLDISNNIIKNINENDVSYLNNSKIRTLKMKNCNILTINPNFLNNFNFIKNLYLNNNSINEENLEKLFDNININNNLTNLHMEYLNKIITMSNEVFRYINNLEVLDLSNGNLQAIEPQIFKSIINVKKINLSFNKLSMLRGLENLKNHKLIYLNLTNNRIEDVSYISLRSIEYFDLSSNRIKMIPLNWLTDNNRLKILNLSNNRITKIDEKSLRRSKIEYLNLSFNKLTSLKSFGASSIKNIDISFNRIKSISINFWKNLDKSLQKINLSYNRIIKLPKYTTVDLKELAQVDLSGNSIGEYLINNNKKTIFNSFQYVQEIILNSCNITVINKKFIKNLKYLTTLSLFNNNIKNIHNLHLNSLQNLLNLNLTKNFINSINPDDLDNIKYLESIDLSFNPWTCSCEIQSFLQWLNKTTISVEYFSKNSQTRYMCSNPVEHRKVPLRMLNFQQLICKEPPSKAIIKTTIITVIALISLSLIVLLTVKFCNISEKIRILQSKWQVRYREVSSLDTHEVHCDSSSV